MIITIASGKGGTGKTTLAVNLAYWLSTVEYKLQQGETPVRLLDCDVEAPNAHLFLKHAKLKEELVFVQRPQWQAEGCNACRKCVDVCKYNALAMLNGKMLFFDELCHSCGACSFICPNACLPEQPASIGKIFFSEEHTLPFSLIYGLMNIGEVLAPSVVREVKKHVMPDVLNILDAPPGTACSVVESLAESDVVVLVTEPTPFGLHDLKLAATLALSMGIPTGIVINRSDGDDRLIIDYAEESNIPILGRIPFSRDYAEAYSRGEMLVMTFPEFAGCIKQIYEKIKQLRGTSPAHPPLVPSFDYLESAEIIPHRQGDAKGFKQVVVVSGKGGTGKTTLSASFAQLAKNKVLFDSDVDAPDLHLLISPVALEKHEFSSGEKAKINPDLCIGCGHCAEHCRFDAIALDSSNKASANVYSVNEYACEGCGMCLLVCPAEAIDMEASVTGQCLVSQTDHGAMVHAQLNIGAENSGKLVSEVRRRAVDMVKDLGLSLVLGDGPPGAGCPVIASITGMDLVLVITEPTVSGLHDLRRVLKLINHFGARSMVIINKSDLNLEMTCQLRAATAELGSRVLGEIPFDSEVNIALIQGKSIVEHAKGVAFERVVALWQQLEYEIFTE